ELDALSLPAGQLEDLYPLSPMQSGMLFHSVFHTDGDIYLNQVRVDIEGLDVTRFKAAWQASVDRHEVLRTGFAVREGEPLQWVAKSVELPFVEHDWRDRANHVLAKQGRDLETLAESEHASGLDLTRPPLMRLTLVRLTDDKHHFIWTSHHLLLDGWSTPQLVGEVLRHYGGNCPEPAFPAGQFRYRNFIEWLQNRDTKVSEAYWRERLRGIAEPTRLAGVCSTPSQNTESGNTGYGKYTSKLGAAVTEELVRFSRRERVTLNTLVQAAWAMLLNRYMGKQTVVFGATVAGRPSDLPGAEHLLGLFINTLPVTATLKPEQEIGAWLRDLQAQNVASREHEHTPLYEIQRWAGQSGQGLFDSILVFENYPMDEALQQSLPGGLVFSEVRGREDTNYPMALSVIQTDALRLEYGYARRHFSEDVVSCIAVRVERLLRQITRDSTRRLGDVELLSEAERAQLKAWGVNERRYGDAEPVHRLIERQVEARPEAVAL
ncbi:Condensation domain-containing protein, partial [Nitrosospira sp. Nl5]|uniref:condensation domain-containing protein n=1 Tax=Nitrosospira sp. Nl5 TaxID=200120 RepID=UPI00088CCF1F